MGRSDKLVEKLKSRPKNFIYDELRKVLKYFDYVEDNKGKTTGSRVAFIHKPTKRILSLHKPHPGNELKLYQIDIVLEQLYSIGVI